MKRALSRMLMRWYVITALIILAVVALYWLTHRPKAPVFDTATAAIGTVVEKVGVTGKISPVDKADLSFEKSGVVKKLNVQVGTVVKKGDIIAKIDDAGDAAALASAQAKLDDLSRGLRPQELSAEQTKVDSAEVALDNAKRDALNAMRSAYISAQGAVVNYADTFFTNPQSPNPTISIRVESQAIQNSINTERVTVGDTLKSWKADVDTLGQPDQAAKFIARASGYANIIKTFLNDLSSIVNNLNPGNAGVSQNTIDAYLATMNTALSSINQSISSLTSASAALNSATAAFEQANNNFNVAIAGSSAQSIRAQAATVASFKAELSKDNLISPIDGLVTRVDPAVGEFVSAGKSSFTVQSNGTYKIEAFVPEADIAKVAIGNDADVTLDAYGADTHFPALVTAVDPAETVLDGVPTYKVTLQFKDADARIRSGMTANTEIITHTKSNVITVPTRAIIEDPSPTATPGAKVVRILDMDGKSFSTVPVAVGLKGSDGVSEVVTGVSAGQKVVTYVK